MTNLTQNAVKNQVQSSTQILEKSLHEKFVFYGKNAREWMRKCTLLLPEIEKHEIWKKHGFTCIYEYAAKIAGMSRNTVDESLRVLRKIEDKPELKKAIEEKGINSVRLVANLATPETDKFWAEKIKEMSSYTLATYVKEFRKNENQAHFEMEIPTAPQIQSITIELDPKIANQLQKLKGQGNWNELMQKLLQAYQAQVEAKKPIPQENAKRYIPAKIKQHALSKTNNTCAFPGCTKEYKYLHHTWRFALTKTHDPDSLIPLCKAHEHLVHAGLIENEDLPPENWKIKLETDKNSEKWQKVDKWVAGYYTGKSKGNRVGP